MITEEYFRRFLMKSKASLEIYDEVYAFLKSKQEAVQQEADALDSKNEREKTLEDATKETELLVKSISYMKLLSKLQEDKAKMLKDLNRTIKQYDFQHKAK